MQGGDKLSRAKYCVLKVVRVTQVYRFVRTNLAVPQVRFVYFIRTYLQFCKVKFYPPKLYKVDLDIFSIHQTSMANWLYLDCICFIWLYPRLLSVWTLVCHPQCFNFKGCVICLNRTSDWLPSCSYLSVFPLVSTCCLFL